MGRCRLGRWGWFVCVRSQSRSSSTHLRKGHSEWRRLGGTCRGLAGPRYTLYLRVPEKASRRFRSSVVVSHGLPLYPSVDRDDLLRGIGQSVPDTLCRHKAPNPFAGGFTKAWQIFLLIPVISCLCVSAIMPLCKLGGACAGKQLAASPGYLRRPGAPCPELWVCTNTRTGLSPTSRPPGAWRLDPCWRGQARPQIVSYATAGAQTFRRATRGSRDNT